jgi:glycosyltransferase involved in cell wall biosynthesis
MNIICFSHLRWNFVYQRPQHLFTRFAKHYTVYFVEEPVLHESDDSYSIAIAKENIFVVTPYLNNTGSNENRVEKQTTLLNKLMREQQIEQYICWYYSPMALQFSHHLHPSLIVYDCMDELSAFKFAPPELKETERQLFDKADVVFTGGYNLYHAKKDLHKNIYPFPSSIEKEHFAKARYINEESHDQKDIPYPRLGFFGVIDERFDIDLIKEVATQKPDWNFVFIGPVIKIDAAFLPRGKNIFYLDSKSYTELPHYISRWDIALIPFAINESTRFISPTKTPEYLAAGKPVISTPIADVVDPYGEKKLVSIVHSVKEFIDAADTILHDKNKSQWLKNVDTFLSDNSWENTFYKMHSIIKKTLAAKNNLINKKGGMYV